MLAHLLSLVAALATVAGGLFVIRHVRGRSVWLRAFLAFGAGYLLAAALLVMIPETFESLGVWAPALVLAGYVLTHVFEHALVPHFHFGEETHGDSEALGRQTFLAATLGLLVHSFFDGTAIGSGFLLSDHLGWVLFLAIVLHKLPDGFTLASLALASGQSSSTAMTAVAGLGLATLLGTVAIQLVASWALPVLAISAGVALYIAATDLMPEVNKERGIRWSLISLAGVATLYLSESLLHGILH